MANSKKNSVKVSIYQLDQVIGKETVIQREISYGELLELVNEVPERNRFSKGKKKMNITTKIVTDQSILYDWYEDKIAGL